MTVATGDNCTVSMADPVRHATTCCPLRDAELALVRDVTAALDMSDEMGRELATAIRVQKENLDFLGAAVARYPPPLESQRLGDRRRSLDTLVHALSRSDGVGFGLRERRSQGRGCHRRW